MPEDDMALADFPRYPLTFGPSPVHRLDRLTEHLGGDALARGADALFGGASPAQAARFQLVVLAGIALAMTITGSWSPASPGARRTS